MDVHAIGTVLDITYSTHAAQNRMVALPRGDGARRCPFASLLLVLGIELDCDGLEEACKSWSTHLHNIADPLFVNPDTCCCVLMAGAVQQQDRTSRVLWDQSPSSILLRVCCKLIGLARGLDSKLKQAPAFGSPRNLRHIPSNQILNGSASQL